MNIQIVGTKLLEQRGERGVREVAKEIGVSPATLSRVERGHLPNLETFGKVCKWLDLDPNEVLGLRRQLPTPHAKIEKDESFPIVNAINENKELEVG